jgi:hypothetical protein
VTTMTLKESHIEKQIDAVIEQEQTARTEEARAVVRARFVEEQRIAQLAKQQAEEAAAHAAYRERAQAAHAQACVQYKISVDAFREARTRLHVLDTILGRGGFSAHHLGVELRHQFAAPDEGDIHDGYRAAEDSISKTLGESS